MKNVYSLKNDVYPLVRLALPLALTGMVQSATFFFETVFLARLGEQSLAAGALVSWFFGVLVVILFGILGSINILVAHRHGSNDRDGIALVARDGLILAVLIAIPSTLLVWNISPIFLLFGQPETVVALVKPYLQALSYGLIADLVAMACLEVIIGVGHARVILIFSILTVVMNIFFSYVLIFGKFGFPALGIAGAGWGMTVSYWGTLIALVVFIIANENYRKYFRHIFKLEKTFYLLELFQIGIPMGVMYSVEVGFFFALTLAMGVLGTEIQAANQVALQYLGLMMSIIFAVAQAITVRMGHLLGAKEYMAAEKASYIGVGIAVAFISIISVIYLVLPEALISVDFDVYDPKNAVIVNEIKTLLAIGALFQIFETARIALFGSLRSLKDTRFTMLASILSFWGIALPVGYLLAFRLQIGGAGFWWGMVVGAAVSVVLLQWRFRLKMKRYNNMANVN